MPTIVAKRYSILRELGRGGMGVVYRARHSFTGELVALKVLNDELARRDQANVSRDRRGKLSGQKEDNKGSSTWALRFKREMQISARIGSEHVIRITDADVAPELNDALFFVMELLQGADLELLLQERGPFSTDETLWILGQVATGLDQAHKAGIIHRDLKPANIFVHRKVNQELIVKILDFGLAFLTRDEGDSEPQAKLTKTGYTMGTLNYFAPEQATGQREKTGPPTDVWALGVITYELLTGQCYFPGTDPSILFKIANGQITAPSDQIATLSPEFDKWFFKSCHLDPESRYQSVGEQVAALADALGVPKSVWQNRDAPSTLTSWIHTELLEVPPDPEEPSTAEATPEAQPAAPIDPLAPTESERISYDPLNLVSSSSKIITGVTQKTEPAARMVSMQTILVGGGVALLALMLVVLLLGRRPERTIIVGGNGAKIEPLPPAVEKPSIPMAVELPKPAVSPLAPPSSPPAPVADPANLSAHLKKKGHHHKDKDRDKDKEKSGGAKSTASGIGASGFSPAAP